MIHANPAHWRTKNFVFKPRPIPRLIASANKPRPFESESLVKHGWLNGIEVFVSKDGGLHNAEPTGTVAATFEASRLKADQLHNRITLKMLNWGDTPRPARKALAGAIQNMILKKGPLEKPDSWKTFAENVFFCQGDEPLGVAQTDPKSGVGDLKTHFLDLLGMPADLYREYFLPNQCHFFNGLGNPDEEVIHFRSFLLHVAQKACPSFFTHSLSDMDQIPRLNFEISLGMGPGGHILFNEPHLGAFRHLPMGRVNLSDESRARGKNGGCSYWTDYAHALTWREEIFWSKRVDLLVTKPKYVDDVFETLAVPLTPENQARKFVPARELQGHPSGRVRFFLSEATAARVIGLLQNEP